MASYRARGPADAFRERRAIPDDLRKKSVHAPGDRTAGSLGQAADGRRTPSARAARASAPAATRVEARGATKGVRGCSSRTQSPIEGEALDLEFSEQTTNASGATAWERTAFGDA